MPSPALLAAAALIGCSHPKPPEKPPTPVRVAAVEQRAESAGARYSANIEPRSRVDASFKVGGYVAAIHQVRGADGRTRDVQEGDFVPAGTVLASVRQSDYTAKVNEAKAQVLKARAGVESGRFQMAQAQAPFEQAKLNWSRAQNLFASQSMTKPDFDAAKANYDAAAARLEAAKAQLSAIETDVSASTEALSEAETALGDAALKAPMSGTVMQKRIEMGSLAAPGAPGFTIADLTSVKANFGVPDVVVSKLRNGQLLDVSTEAWPGAIFRGRITNIAPAADIKTRVFSIELTIANPRGQLKPGMIATISMLDASSAKSALVVPLTAVVQSKEGGNRYAVFVITEQGGTTVGRQRAVQLGDALGDSIAVTSGLNAGERVVSTGASMLVDGERVQVIP